MAARLRADLREGVVVEQRVVRGPVLPTILAQAERFGADLIVVGSRNRGPLRSTVLGSVGRELIASAPVPVLVARGGRMDRVLLAHDGSQTAGAAVQIVASWPIFAESLVRMFSVADASAGDATAQILTATALEESALIVLGSAAAHGLDRLLHGDLADDLVPRTRCSLLVVPGTSRGGVKPRELALSRFKEDALPLTPDQHACAQPPDRPGRDTEEPRWVDRIAEQLGRSGSLSNESCRCGSVDDQA